jgi:hypothetical protein
VDGLKIKSRRGLAGILAGVILFGIIFTTGFSLLLYVNASTQTSNQANANRENANLQSANEKLLVTANVTSHPALWVGVVNTGGVATTITDIYVTCQSDCPLPNQMGQLISNSVANPPSHFLSESPKDLNVTLPSTLNVGASENINITSLKWTPPEHVVVSLLTSTGNVFSAQYPPAPLANTTNVVVHEESTEVLLNQVAGGPQLSVMLTASALCPDGTAGCTQTFSCTDGCVTVAATVINLANSTASGVSVTLGTPSVGGTASVMAYSNPLCTFSGGSTTTNIPADMQATATCQFSASTGATGGLASFSGTASGTVGFPVTSADSVSNSIEIGGLSSVTTQGAFVANFFFLKYSSCYQNTGGNFAGLCQTNASPLSLSNLPDAGTTAAGSNFFVAFYVQVTNVLNSRLPILEYSYIYGDPASSADNFIFLAGSNSTMTNGAYYPDYHPTGGGNPTLTAYPGDCSTVNGSNTPTDSNCIYLDPGQTVNLTFAACGYGASNWAWGSYQDAQKFDSSVGCIGTAADLIAPEAMPLGVVVSYLFNGQVYTQVMPFQAMQFVRSSATSVSCSPSGVTAGTATTCTATVLNTDGFPKSIAPGGTVTFSGQAVGQGTLNSTSCTIFFGSCSVTYTPFLTAQGEVSMTATYQGDNSYAKSSNVTSITILDPTTTTVTGSCAGATVLDNTAATCTVTVKDVTGGVPSTPTGTVTMSDNPSGYGAFGACNLAAAGVGTATCTVTYTPNTGSGGPITITATYNGDASHGGSSGSTGLTAKATPTIATSLSASSITIGGSATDTATFSGAYNPTGSVTFTAYSNSACTTLVYSSTKAVSGSASTSGSFTPTSVGTYYWKASYPGDSYNTAYTTTCGAGGESLTVNKASPTITTTVSSGGTILVGKSASDSGTFSGGYGTLKGTLVFSAFTSSTCSVSASFTSSTVTVNGNGPYTSNSYTPPSAGTYYWQATFTDTDGSNYGFTSACGGSGETLTVVTALSVATPSATPSTIDSGHSSSLSDTFSGGIGPYTCQWLQEAPGAGAFSNLGSSSSCTSPASASTGTLSTTGTWHFELKVTDSTGATATSNPVSVTVNTAFVAPVISVSPTVVVSSSSPTGTLSTTTSFSGGTSAYSCQWLVEAPGGSYSNLGSSFTTNCSSTGKPTISTGTLSTPGIWQFELQVTDSTGATVTSSPVTVNSLSLSVSPTSVPNSGGHSGRTVTLSGNGYGSITYSYCLSSTMATSGCIGSTEATFSGTGTLGSIPGGTNFVVPSGQAAGTYYVLVYTGTTVLIYTSLTVT